MDLFDGITEALSTEVTLSLASERPLIAATVGAAQVLTEMRTVESYGRAREIIDNALVPFFEDAHPRHPLRTMIFPEILISRVEVASEPQDQDLAVENIMRYYEKDLRELCTDGQPQEWLHHINSLANENKWGIIKRLADRFIKSRRSLHELMEVRSQYQYDKEGLNEFHCQVDLWIEIGCRLGKACLIMAKWMERERLIGKPLD